MSLALLYLIFRSTSEQTNASSLTNICRSSKLLANRAMSCADLRLFNLYPRIWISVIQQFNLDIAFSKIVENSFRDTGLPCFTLFSIGNSLLTSLHHTLCMLYKVII